MKESRNGNVVAIVTGAAGGIGSALCHMLAERGATVCALDIDTKSLRELSENPKNTRIAPFVCDVSNEEQVCITVEDIFTRFGPAHVLINNAGVLRDAALVNVKPGGIQTLSTTQWRSVIEVNLTGTFLATREVAERMIRTKTRGVIINMSSISRKGNAGQSSYAASKAAVAALVTTWARELSLFGIRVVGIAPGLVATPLIDAIPIPILQANIQRTPSRRLGRPDEIAAAVASVLDNDFVNGRTLEIDGGLEL